MGLYARNVVSCSYCLFAALNLLIMERIFSHSTIISRRTAITAEWFGNWNSTESEYQREVAAQIPRHRGDHEIHPPVQRDLW